MTNHLDTSFAALADPTRRAIVEHLVTGPAPVSELHAPHDIALPTFLKHLGKLESAGLVRSEKKGRVRFVHIETAEMARLEDWISAQRRSWNARLDKLARLADTMERTRS